MTFLEKICKRDVVTTTEDKSITEVAKLMRDHSIGDIVVVDKSGEKNVPIGLVTDRDIVVSAIAENVDKIQNCVVRDVMSTDIICARVDEAPYDVAMRMRDNGVARMPVIDQNGQLCGIVTSNHLFRLIHEEMMALAEISRKHKEPEAATASKGGQRSQGKRTNATQASLQ
jgi:CBS domain-containing protein